MLLNDHLDRDISSVRVCEHMTEFLDRPLYSSRMMSKSTVSPVTGILFRFIEPVMDLDVISGVTTPFSHSSFTVFPRCHVMTPLLGAPSTILGG